MVSNSETTAIQTTDPQAAMIIWSYDHRLSSQPTKGVGDISQIILPTTSIIDMSTSKQKGSPAGSFKVTMAPTFNWISRITPGSWCVLLMSRETPIEDLQSVGKVDERTFRMLGRIETVRLQHGVNQQTGARYQQYVVTGSDWGSVFNSVLFFDSIGSNQVTDQDPNIGQALRILFNSEFQSLGAQGAGPPTTTQIMQGIINMWGTPLPDVSDKLNKANIAATSEAQFTLPSGVVSYMGLEPRDVPGVPTVLNKGTGFASLINMHVGPLTAYDSYPKEHKGDAQGIPEPNSFNGMNSFWSLLQKNSNPILNEMIADVRFEGGGDFSGYDASKSKPALALYKRVRPFTMTNKIEGDEKEPDPNSLPGVKNNISYYKNVRRILLPHNDVIQVNAGSNWRDKLNYIEIFPRVQNLSDNFDALLKSQMQTVDRKAYQREGFKPLMETAVYVPYIQGSTDKYNFTQALEWKYLLRDWHFNTHLMLNGSISFVGVDRYIQVGDNITVDSRVVGMSQNFNKEQLANRTKDGKADTPNAHYFTAHVEGISHSMGVDNQGARTFVTSINFVRGVITDVDGKLIGLPAAGDSYATDESALSTSHSDERNSAMSIVTDLGVDPDKADGGGFKIP
jgi:hypothetical protein